MRLIDADDVIMRHCAVNCGCTREECGLTYEEDGCDGCTFVKEIENAPSVDAEPVQHAVWRRKDKELALFDVEWECTNCHDTIALNGILTPIGNGFRFCPYCGAKMGGCEQDENA